MKVHIMVGGYPLCGFSMQLPAFWPEGEKWTRNEEQATCGRCRVEWDKETPGEMQKAHDREKAKARAFE